ncbi:MAG: EAL domain-containing protein, partial [Clostridia bacterium]|nr:EAL domain-containing protein [Clostridia bacterium]
GSVALTEPIVYFYDACQNGDSTINYLNVQQVLNDKFLGKLLPPQYVAIAENSERSEELNLFAIEKVLEDIKENEKYTFCLAISCRTFARKHSHEKLVKLLSNNDCSRLILAFDAGMLAALGKKGIEGLDEIRSLGAKVMIDVGVDFGLDLLTDYAMDYLRLDARYYRENDARRTAILDMITGYTTVQGITTVMSGVEDNKESKHYVMHDIDVIQGFASCEPDRNIPHAVKYMKKLPLVVKDK